MRYLIMKTQIKNKSESKDFILKRGFNYFPDLYCHKVDVEKIINFIVDNPAQLYIIRDAIRPQSPFYFFTHKEECLCLLDQFHDHVIIAVSVNAYKEYKIILGTIEITSDNRVMLTASLDANADHRSIFSKNDFNINCQISDRVLDKVPEFDQIYAFLVDNELIDVIVEYTIYSIPVGVNHQKLVIQEIRNY